jgi:hypothetical protein
MKITYKLSGSKLLALYLGFLSLISCAWLFEPPIEIRLKNDYSSAITMTLIYDTGRERQWSMPAGARILMTKQHAHEVLTKIVVAVNGAQVQTCHIPPIRPAFACFHLGPSGCWVTKEETSQTGTNH